ncbi:MAG: hypothetical protein M3270_11010 [Thermoproteota archaeon]|nr:hypothetical protein [Thermoproteota archaeon]
MSSGYSEEDIRRAAEIREWLIKEISDRQEEVERLRTTLSIIDNLLKQGSFRAAANLGFSTTASSAQAEPATTTAATTTQVQQQQAARQTAAQSTAVKRPQQQQSQVGTTTSPTLTAPSDGGSISGGDDDNNNKDIKPLKRVKDDFLLANAEITSDAVVIVPAPGINLNSNTPPFKSFFLNRILEGMKGKDTEKVNQGALRESDALSYRVEEGEDDSSGGGSSSGIIKRIVINKYRDKERLQEIFNTSAWVFTRMLEKSGSK